MVKKNHQYSHRPFTWFEWLIAWRYLKSRRRDGGISVIAWYALVGVTLGVGTLIVVQAVMLGFRVEFTNKIIGANAHISVFSNKFDRDLNKASEIIRYINLKNEVVNVGGVVGAIPIIKSQVMGSGNGKSLGLQVFGINQDDIALLPSISKPEFSLGSLSNFEKGIAIGNEVARQLQLQIGDKIKLLSPEGVQTAFGTMPRVSDFTVQYIFKVGRYDIDNTRLYMPLIDAQKYFNRENSVDQLDIMLSNPDDVETVKSDLSKLLSDKYILWTWKESSSAFLNALDVERRVMLIILSLVILIAALNIISGLVMLVKNKTKDIAILRTVGFSQGSIMRIFFICGSLIGIFGTILGLFWGCLFAIYISEIQQFVEMVIGGQVWNSEIRFLTEVPAELRIKDLLVAIIVSLGISFTITIIPARNAAKINPIEAMRND